MGNRKTYLNMWKTKTQSSVQNAKAILPEKLAPPCPVSAEPGAANYARRSNMIFQIEKRRFRKDGKLQETRSYYLRYRIGDMPVDRWKSLGVTDKQVADKRAHEFIQERERENAGILEPKAMRDAARKAMAVHLEDYKADLAARGRNGRGGRGATGRGGMFGAGEGNRTLVASLEDWSSTIELHPQRWVDSTMPKPVVNRGGRRAEYGGVAE